MTLQWIDWLVICLYAVTILSAGFLLARKTQSSEGYFLAGRALRWPVIGASLFAANISAEHFVAWQSEDTNGRLSFASCR